jgi:hypothetical protein
MHTTMSRLNNKIDNKGETSLGASSGLETDSDLMSHTEDPVGGLTNEDEINNFKAYPWQGQPRKEILKLQELIE